MTHFLLRIIKLSFYLNLSPSERRKNKAHGSPDRALTAIGGDGARRGGITVTGNKQPTQEVWVHG